MGALINLNMQKGEIWTSNPPAKGGHVQQGARPALILATPTKSIAVVAPITSALAVTRFPYTVAVSSTPQNGLDKPSVILVFQQGAMDKRFLHHKIGDLESSVLQQVNSHLASMLWLHP